MNFPPSPRPPITPSPHHPITPSPRLHVKLQEQVFCKNGMLPIFVDRVFLPNFYRSVMLDNNF
ncbi:hypothetical protein WH8501_18480 [Crocosphaera watsonii WH 8501]|uniref:hypothetical protein n=1 Tax=Crocosphaera watsonii TaxID=263511 RepID=UPI0002F59DB4|nr:hypothetical protein [Crocosphaera watsonii]